MKIRGTCLVALSALALACGSSDEDPDGTGPSTDKDGPGMKTDGTGDPMSPLGDPTDPMDPTMDPTTDPTLTDPGELEAGTNGTMPCAPAINSGFAGDELCIMAPDPGTGIHMHAGPEDYDNPDEVAPFLLAPGDESTDYFGLNTDNTETLNFYKQYYRMRPGSHHLIISQWNQPIERGWYDTRSDIPGERLIIIGGTQRSSMDYPPGGVAPEDELFFRPVNPQTGMAFELHYVNATDQPILREAWVNFMENEKAFPDGIILGAPFLIGADFAVPPGATQVLNYTAYHDEGTEPMRIVSIFGHRHANTDRFTVWAHRGGQRELVYEDYSWEEPAELFYNTITTNPAPDPATLTPGGFSGIVALEPGDALEWECEVNNRSGVTLTVGNDVYEGEMCNLFGTLTVPGYPIWFDRPPLIVK